MNQQIETLGDAKKITDGPFHRTFGPFIALGFFALATVLMVLNQFEANRVVDEISRGHEPSKD